MAALRVLARAELRRAWRTLLLVGLVAGLAGGVVGGTVALAQRTVSAPDRLAAASRLDDARLQAVDPALVREVAALPYVRAAWLAQTVVGQVAGDATRYLSVSAGPPPPPGLFTPVVVRGRAVRPDAVDEVVVTEEVAAGGLDVGTVVDLALLLPEEVFAFDTGFGAPDGPHLALRVVGVLRLPTGGNGVGPAFASPAFAARYAALSPGPTLLMRLAPGRAARAQLRADVARLAAAGGKGAAPGFTRPEPVFPDEEVDPQMAVARRALAGGLSLFALLAAAAGLLVVGQALGRTAGAGAAAQRTEAALGLVRRQRVLGRVAPAGLAAAVAAGLTAAGVLLGGRLEPLGGLRAYEPEPGWLPDPALAAAGAGLAALVVLVVQAACVLRAGAAAPDRARRWAPALPPLLRRRPAAAVGAGFALQRSGRGAALAAAVAVAGVVASAVLAGSLDRLGQEQERWGWVADFAVADVDEGELARLVADPALSSVQTVDTTSVRLGDRFADALALTDRKGTLPPVLLTGRMPRTDGELVAGAQLARERGLSVGDLVTVGDERRPHRVTGIAVIGFTGTGQRAGTAVLLTRTDLAAAAATSPFREAAVQVADRARVDAVRRRYAAELEVMTPEPSVEVRTLGDLSRLPHVLQACLLLALVAGLGHVLLQAASRRRADLAVLRALGLTPRQVGATLLLMAGLVAVAGVALGLPLGLLAGRLVWAEVAASAGVAGDVLVPLGTLLALLAGVLVAALVVALLPARRAARLSPAAELRAE